MLVANETYRYFGLYAIVLFTCVGLLITAVWHEDNALTFSKHVGRHKTSYILFAVSSVLGQGLFISYMLKWFIPTFQLGAALAVVISLGTICQLLSAWIPDTKGLLSKVHHYTAYTMAYVMLSFGLWIALSPTIGIHARVFALGSFLIMSYLIWLVSCHEQYRQKMFIYQNAYIALFYATVLVSGYVR